MRVVLFQNQRLHARKASTLAEVLVSAMVVSITTISLYATFFSGYALTSLSRDDLRATQIMLEKIEAFRRADWTALSNCPIHFQDSLQSAGQGTVFSGVVTTRPVPGLADSASYQKDLLLLSVNVFWTNHAHNTVLVRQREMQTTVARYGWSYHAPGTGS